MKSRTLSALMLLVLAAILCLCPKPASADGKEITFSSEVEARPNPLPRVASNLQQAMDFVKNTTKAEKAEYFSRFDVSKPAPFRVDDSGRIQCYIRCRSLNPDTLEKLRGQGVQAHLTEPSEGLVQTWLTSEQIRKIEKLPEVQFIRLPSYPVCNVGSVTTEGYQAMQIHKFVNRPEFIGTNVTGRGIKVGVISSAIYRADLSSQYGDLPRQDAPTSGTFGGVKYFSWRTNPYTGLPYGIDLLGIITYWAGDYDEEGTAMLEIIHDIVPDAQLYFSNFDTDLEMNMSKDWLRAQGCDVIVDDIGFLNSGPYDGSSVVSQGSTRQVDNGVAYYTSVGNHAQDHLWGNFSDPEANNIHNFGLKDETMEIRIPSGGSAAVYVAWDEPYGSSGYDIDLYLLDPNYLDFTNPYSYSTTLQLGDGEPTEALTVYNNTYNDATASVVITRKSRLGGYNDAAQPMRMNLFVIGAVILEKEYMIEAGSILNNADAGSGVISVAAIDVSSSLHNIVEYFSSRGPTWDGRQKPEIASFDGTSGGYALRSTPFARFFGTSCSAPHAAGVAALIKGYKITTGDPDFIFPPTPKAVVDNINAAIFQGAEDMLPAGLDYMSGYGRVNAENIFINFLNVAGRRKYFNFATDAEGWTFGSAPLYYTVPEARHENGALLLKSQGNNTFGFWQSPVISFSDSSINLNASKLYIARFRISTSAVDDKYPGFRIRVNDSMNTNGATRAFSARLGQNHAPGAGTDYYLHFQPTLTEATNGISLAFDLAQIESEGLPNNETLYLQEVEIVEYDLPIIP